MSDLQFKIISLAALRRLLQNRVRVEAGRSVKRPPYGQHDQAQTGPLVAEMDSVITLRKLT